ncbi:hypothetical protein [Parerythrobacter aestuarii]|uniref:hypothetical protein n=1 Tax=Parerythrobacter aestuarii TaxID=3020909 RepID=UPI0024DE6215|nr:hypothetical protein [Parerythrobacter aestuarii]
MIATAMALFLVAQQANESVLAVYPDDPTSWTLDYPVRIEPQVSEYYNCLRGGSYTIGDDVSFETQYRNDIPRCAKRGDKLEAEANAVLARNDSSEATPPDEVAQIFERARRIHVARGQSLDLAVRTRLASATANVQDTACLAGVQTLIDQRASYMQAEQLRIEALVGKQRYTDEEQQVLARYRGQLAEYNTLISNQRDRCRANPAPQPAAFDQPLEDTVTNAQD